MHRFTVFPFSRWRRLGLSLLGALGLAGGAVAQADADNHPPAEHSARSALEARVQAVRQAWQQAPAAVPDASSAEVPAGSQPPWSNWDNWNNWPNWNNWSNWSNQ